MSGIVQLRAEGHLGEGDRGGVVIGPDSVAAPGGSSVRARSISRRSRRRTGGSRATDATPIVANPRQAEHAQRRTALSPVRQALLERLGQLRALDGTRNIEPVDRLLDVDPVHGLGQSPRGPAPWSAAPQRPGHRCAGGPASGPPGWAGCSCGAAPDDGSRRARGPRSVRVRVWACRPSFTWFGRRSVHSAASGPRASVRRRRCNGVPRRSPAWHRRPPPAMHA